MHHSHALTTAVLTSLAGVVSAQPLFPPSIPLTSLDGTNGFVLTRSAGDGSFGVSVAGGQDVNQDGVPDLLIGDHQALGNNGWVFVVFGGAGVGASGSVDVDALDGTNGYVIGGVPGNGEQAGFSVASVGDVDLDGAGDILIGSPTYTYVSLFDVGAAHIVFGGAAVGAGGGPVFLSSGPAGTDIRYVNVSPNSQVGYSVSAAGDVNGDQIPDFLISDPKYDVNTEVDAGATYVVFGAPGLSAGSLTETDLLALDGTDGYTIKGNLASGQSGFSVSGAGDLNGDAIDDIIIGAPQAEFSPVTRQGRVYVVFGGQGVGATGEVDLGSLDGTNGFVLDGTAEDGSFAESVSGAGDVNGDGFDDFIIGAERVDPVGRLSAGQSYVVFGGPNIGQGSISLNGLDGTDGFSIDGLNADDFSGTAVSAAGDLNNDGYADLAVTAPGGESGAPPLVDSGECYIIFGGPGVGGTGQFLLNTLNGDTGFVVRGVAGSDQIGDSVAPAGDINQDGIDDLIIGGQHANGVGEAYVIFGRSIVSEWTPLQGGSFDDPANWDTGLVPTSGQIVIEPNFGGIVTGPAGTLSIDSLTLGAGAGRTTLETQPGSLLNIASELTIPASAEVSGAGLIACERLNVDGVIRMDGMTFVTRSPFFNINAGGRAEIHNALLDGIISNFGEITIGDPQGASAPSSLETLDAVINHSTGEIIVFGDTQLRCPDLSNDGSVSFVASGAVLYGTIGNDGVLSASGSSSLTLVDDLLNNGTFVLAQDSSVGLLGSLTGNGITGPGGGAGGPVFIEGDVIPGMALQAGTAAFGGDVGFGAGSALMIDLAGSTLADRVTSLGDVTISGSLIVQSIDGYAPEAGDSFTLVTGSSVQGTFTDTVLPAAPKGFAWDLAYSVDRVVLSLVGAQPADLNNDGTVGSADLALLLAGWGGAEFDINGDGLAGASDLAILLAAWGS